MIRTRARKVEEMQDGTPLMDADPNDRVS